MLVRYCSERLSEKDGHKLKSVSLKIDQKISLPFLKVLPKNKPCALCTHLTET